MRAGLGGGRLAMAATIVLAMAAPTWAQAQGGPTGAMDGQTPSHTAPPAAAAAPSAADLAKKLANPISDLVSIPFQFNWDQGVGPTDGLRFMMYAQPVVPMSVSEQVEPGRSLRPPARHPQPPLCGGEGMEAGTGDTPVLGLPLAEAGQADLGRGARVRAAHHHRPRRSARASGSLGPTAVVLKQQGPWTLGALVNQLWSVGKRVERRARGRQPDVPAAVRRVRPQVGGHVHSQQRVDRQLQRHPVGQQWTVPRSSKSAR